MSNKISGIQQVGIGVTDVKASFDWYRKNLGMDVLVFEEAAEANLMLKYTGGKPAQRHAIMAINLAGGGGFEIWQHTSKTPELPRFDIQLGDLGIFAAMVKTQSVLKSHQKLTEQSLHVSKVLSNPVGEQVLSLKDPFGNYFSIQSGIDWFQQKYLHGGCFGALIGVSDMTISKPFYQNILGYDQVIFEGEGFFDDLSFYPGGQKRFKRVILGHSKQRKGAFSKLLGASRIELFQAMDYSPRKIYADRFWGDPGFIQLCFDVFEMDKLAAELKSYGVSYVVDSAQSFDMGEAAGRFSYIEDPDGTLIEFVETHKIPVAKKFGLFINLKNRNPQKPLPSLLLKMLGLNRVL